MAIRREVIKKYEGVKFESFPLVHEKRTQNSEVWIFGGGGYSIFNCWSGDEYEGRYRFHTPARPELKGKELLNDILNGIWDLRIMKEIVRITNANGEKMDLERQYFCLEPSHITEPQYYAGFVGGYYKRTIKGYGRNRDFRQYVVGDVEVLATTRNRCRSGRYGNYASFVISSEPLMIEGEGEA